MLNYLLSFLSINTVGAGHPYSKQQQLMLNVAMIISLSLQLQHTAFNSQCVSDFGSGVAISFGLFLSNQQVSSTVLMWRD